MSDATVNIHVQSFLWTCVIFSPGWIPTSRTVGSYSGYMSDFLINWQTMCQSSYTAALATSRAGLALSSHPHQCSYHLPPLPPAGQELLCPHIISARIIRHPCHQQGGLALSSHPHQRSPHPLYQSHRRVCLSLLVGLRRLY